MQFLSLLAASAVVSAASLPSDSCQPVANTCSYYSQCVEPVFNCGPKGYPLGYGGHFCQAFKDDYPNFTPAGQKWLYSVMNCLQGKLVPVVSSQLSGASTLTCSQLQTFAYGTHPECYTLETDSICQDVPPQDMVRLLVIIKSVLFDPATIKQALKVIETCPKQYVQDVLRYLAHH
ncbi:hypothetical protein HDV03_003960 [Kappamyces sp. JEL0829]|nr:hypothetical protein HDV03_003960 [Kappamyces sp. JEL0829]